MHITPRENLASWILLITTVLLGFFASGITPQIEKLPFEGALLVATVVGAVAGVIATPHRWRGLIAGALTGAGMFLGLRAYVAFFLGSLGSRRLYSRLAVFGALPGAIPGLTLYWFWARHKPGAMKHDAKKPRK